MAGPDWRSGRLAVVLTADEDDMSRDNRVLTVVVHPSLRGKVVSERLDHAAARFLEDVAGGAVPRERPDGDVARRRVRPPGRVTSAAAG